VLELNERDVVTLRLVMFFFSQHLKAIKVVTLLDPLASKLTASGSNLINKSQTGFKINAMKFALAIASTLSKGIRLANSVETTYKKCDKISTGSNIDVVSKLNISFKVAPLKARLNSFGSPANVNAINELVTHVPIFEPIIIGIADCTSGIMPAPTILTAIDVVAVAFCIMAVNTIPIAKAANGFAKINLITGPALIAYGATIVKPMVIKLRDNKKKYNKTMKSIIFRMAKII
jgi:hypothetical protein